MDNVHSTFQRIFAAHPSVPKITQRSSINDDDIYLWDARTRSIVGHYGASSCTASLARRQGLALPAGRLWFTGMQLKGSGLVDLEAA